MKLYLNDVYYATAQRRCSADGGHLYHYKSLAFDREPIRQLLDNSGGYSCYQRFLLQLIRTHFQSLVSCIIAFAEEQKQAPLS